MNKHKILVLTLIICLKLVSQNEDKVWYFGPNGAGIDFRNCTPIVKTNGNTNSSAFEGVVSICDALTGRLLFYCTEAKIIDSTFNIMPNGLNVGNGTSGTQSTIIRKPGSNNIYYYFVTDIQGGAIASFDPNAKGISYAIVDMSLNGGLGSVVSSHNPIKDTSNCEKLTAVKHSNGNDVWLLAHEYRNNNFLVYSITSSGINLTPAVYGVGPTLNATQTTAKATSKFDAIGELKASPDGSRLAYTTLYNGITCIFDFNKSTGTISNPIPLDLGGFGGYGVSFSPDNKKLYISCVDTTNFNQLVNGQIVQFDLTSGIQATIQSSKQVIGSCTNCSFRSLKLAPNGKIYCAKQPTIPESQWLGVINFPNNPGTSCYYVHNALYLNGLYGSWGLNNLMESNNYCSEPTGLENQKLTFDFIVNYNYSANTINIENFSESITLKLFDISGKMIKQNTFDVGISRMDVSDLENGIYIISIFSDSQPAQQLKILKTN